MVVATAVVVGAAVVGSAVVVGSMQYGITGLAQYILVQMGIELSGVSSPPYT